jgi:hypothetical protein
MRTLEGRAVTREALDHRRFDRIESRLEAKFTVMIALQNATLTVAIVWLLNLYVR